MKKKLSIIFILLAMTGCSCKQANFRIIEPMNPKTDPKLSCIQLRFAMAEAEYFLRSANRKEAVSLAYSSSPICIVNTQLGAVQAQEAAKDRIDYLNTIMEQKNCDKPQVEVEKPKDQGLVKIPTKK